MDIMNVNEYLTTFFAELERLVDGHGTRHTVSTRGGQLEIRLGAGNWYRVASIDFGPDPVKTAASIAKTKTTWPDSI
jgi:hypothetical protein